MTEFFKWDIANAQWTADGFELTVPFIQPPEDQRHVDTIENAVTNRLLSDFAMNASVRCVGDLLAVTSPDLMKVNGPQMRHAIDDAAQSAVAALNAEIDRESQALDEWLAGLITDTP